MNEQTIIDWPGQLSEPDVEAIVEYINSTDAIHAASLYDKLHRDWYWKRKDLASTVRLCESGITYLTTAATREADKIRAEKLLGHAKTLAANLASFTWPGWNEAGVAITVDQQKAGLEAARLNVKFADELNHPGKAKANALWTLGAQLLAAKDFAGAIEAFSNAGKQPEIEPGMVDMLAGYIALVGAVKDRSDVDAQANFQAAVAKLEGLENPDGMFFAGQLRTAQAVFLKSY